MKSKLWIVTLSSLALVAGCAAPNGDFCVVARPIYMANNDVVDWLAENDEAALRSIVSHNEKTAQCR